RPGTSVEGTVSVLLLDDAPFGTARTCTLHHSIGNRSTHRLRHGQFYGREQASTATVRVLLLHHAPFRTRQDLLLDHALLKRSNCRLRHAQFFRPGTVAIG